MKQKIKELDVVILHGTIVHIYKNAYEIEFVGKSGKTSVLLTISKEDLEDILK